jgi:hypothetical protein
MFKPHQLDRWQLERIQPIQGQPPHYRFSVPIFSANGADRMGCFAYNMAIVGGLGMIVG